MAKNLFVFGYGNMGSAIVHGIITSFYSNDYKITVIEPDASKHNDITAANLSFVTALPEKQKLDYNYVLLAIKPNQVADVLTSIGKKITPNTVVLSICAGITIKSINDIVGPDVPVIRAMPNTPAKIKKGMTAIAANAKTDRTALDRVRGIFETVGNVVEVAEKDFDIVTGLSGSGPAYVFRMIEAMTAAGVENGLSEQQAFDLATRTIIGATELAISDDKKDISPRKLAEQVSSPNGTTVAGLAVMDKANFIDTVKATVTAATKRSKEISEGK